MLPASELTEILANLSALNLQPNTAAQVLSAVLAPLLRSSGPDVPLPVPEIREKRPRSKPRRSSPRPKRKKARSRAAVESAAVTDGPRERARAALKENPGLSLTAVAKLAGASRSTVVNARDDLAAEARKAARETAKPSEPRDRAQKFLKDTLAHGAKPVSDVEAAAEKAHISPHALTQARGDLGVVTWRANAGSGSTLSVQWSLPG